MLLFKPTCLASVESVFSFYWLPLLFFGFTLAVLFGVASAIDKVCGATWRNWLYRHKLTNVIFSGAMTWAIGILSQDLKLDKFLSPDEAWASSFSIVTALGAAALFQLIVFNRSDRDSEVSKEQLTKARENLKQSEEALSFTLALNKQYLKAVKQKRLSLPKSQKTPNQKLRIDSAPVSKVPAGHIEIHVDPESQIFILLSGTYAILEKHVREQSGGKDFRVRLAMYCYESDSRSFIQIFGWDGFKTDKIRGGKEGHHKAHFKLPKNAIDKCESNSLLLAAAKADKSLAIADADSADRDPDSHFVYFDERQKTQIRSMVAIPLCVDVDSAFSGRVLCVDTDLRDAFLDNLEHRDRYNLIRTNLEERLIYELGIAELAHRPA